MGQFSKRCQIQFIFVTLLTNSREELPKILMDFAREAIRENPEDLAKFGVAYFEDKVKRAHLVHISFKIDRSISFQSF